MQFLRNAWSLASMTLVLGLFALYRSAYGGRPLPLEVGGGLLRSSPGTGFRRVGVA